MFQSTPVIADERIVLVPALFVCAAAFQSTPVIADERIHETLCNTALYAKNVSIHARHC